jgi:hypothetical protein
MTFPASNRSRGPSWAWASSVGAGSSGLGAGGAGGAGGACEAAGGFGGAGGACGTAGGFGGEGGACEAAGGACDVAGAAGAFGAAGALGVALDGVPGSSSRALGRGTDAGRGENGRSGRTVRAYPSILPGSAERVQARADPGTRKNRRPPRNDIGR